MQRLIFIVFVALTSSNLSGAIIDAFDISNGSTILSTSLLLNENFGAADSDARDAFGGTFSNIETGNTLFVDTEAPGTVHFIEFSTASPITLLSFDLQANGDAPPDYNRGTSHFTLLGKLNPGDNFTVLFDQDISAAGAGVSSAVPAMVAQIFRIELTQNNLLGPRIIELDGFADVAQVPEPASGGMAGIALLGIVFVRWRMRAA